MAEDLTVPAGLTDYLVILWMDATLDYDASFPVDFQFVADAYNGILDNFDFPFPTVEAIQIKSNADCITDALKSCRNNWNLIETSDRPFPVAMARNNHILSNRGIRRIKTYLSKSALPNKASLLNDCKRLEELRKTFRETPVTDTIAAIVTPYPADDVRRNFALPNPLEGIEFLYISAISRKNFIKSCGGFNSDLARAVARELRTPRGEKSWVLTEIERLLNSYLAPYLLFGEHSAGITPAPDAADATAEETPATDTAETVEAEPGAAAVAYPDGLEVIEENKGGALDAGFLKEVLPNVQYIHGQETDRPERWEHPCQITHRERLPWTVFEWEGIRYRAWKEEYPKKRYAVKWEIQEQEKLPNRVFEFKNEG